MPSFFKVFSALVALEMALAFGGLVALAQNDPAWSDAGPVAQVEAAPEIAVASIPPR